MATATVPGSGGPAASPATTTPPATPTAPVAPDLAGISAAAQSQAAQQVQQEIKAQTDPLQQQISSDQRSETQALGSISSEFNQVQPQVQAAATAVGASYTDAEKAQSDIFTAANANLAQLKGQQAQQAQMLAQQIGGPVALGQFTAGLDNAQASLIELGAGQQLHTLGYAQAGVQSANQFSGQVFPLLRTEQMATARQYFQNQIKDLNSKISDLHAGAAGQIHTRYNELQQQQLQYQLDLATQRLNVMNAEHTWAEQTYQDKQAAIKANRDWQQQLTTNAQAQQQLKISQQQADTSQASAEAATKLGEEQLTNEEKNQAATLNLNTKQYLLQKQQLASSTKIALATLNANQAATDNALIDSALNPQPGKTITSTHAVPVAAAAAISGRVKDAYADKTSPTGYSRLVQVVETPTTTPITDPHALVDFLVAHNVPKAKAVNLVKLRLGIPNWTYTKKQPKAATKKKSSPMTTGPNGSGAYIVGSGPDATNG